MRKIWNNLNNQNRVYNHRVIDQPSQTVQDQTMSVRELLERHTSNQPLEGNLNPIYQDPTEDNTGINPLTLDYVDLQVMKMENKEKINAGIETIKQGRIEHNNVVRAKKREEELNKAIAENEAKRRKEETDKKH